MPEQTVMDDHDRRVFGLGIRLSMEVTRLLRFAIIGKWLDLMADAYAPSEVATTIRLVREIAAEMEQARIDRVQNALGPDRG